MKQNIVKLILLAYLTCLLLTGCSDSDTSFASCNLQAVAAGSEYCQEVSGN